MVDARAHERPDGGGERDGGVAGDADAQIESGVTFAGSHDEHHGSGETDHDSVPRPRPSAFRETAEVEGPSFTLARETGGPLARAITSRRGIASDEKATASK
jgi:hypothetical protein